MQVPIKPKYTRSGETWMAHSVPRLYLDDIIFIYRVMNDYAEASPSFQQARGKRQEWNELVKTHTSASGNDELVNSLLLTLRPLPAPVSMEAGDYIPSTIEELQSLQLDGVAEFDMNVGTLELRLVCRRWVIELNSYNDDKPAMEAFERIRGRIQKRQNRFLHGLFRGRTLGAIAIILWAEIIFLSFQSRSIHWILMMSFPFAVAVGLVWYWLAWGGRHVVVLDYERNLAKPWYRSNELKAAIAMVLVTALASWLLSIFQ